MKLPSRFQINEKVDVDLQGAGRIINGFVVSIRFTESKVYYNILIQTDNDVLTLIEDIDSAFVQEANLVPVSTERAI